MNIFFWGSDDFIYEKKTLENINKIILTIQIISMKRITFIYLNQDTSILEKIY